MLTLGIDDAGRGPLIGPMILAGVLIDKKQEEYLKKYKIRDSKQIQNSQMHAFAKIVKENSQAYFIAKTYPEEIDSSIESGTNLNEVEAIKAALIINEIVKKFKDQEIKVVIDCPSTNLLAWKNSVMSKIFYKDNLDFHVEHKADANYIAVAAGSILAKSTREEEVEKLKKQYGPIGSGYPSDPETKEFLKKRGKEFKDSGIFRKSWATWKVLFPSGSGQATLEGF